MRDRIYTSNTLIRGGGARAEGSSQLTQHSALKIGSLRKSPTVAASSSTKTSDILVYGGVSAWQMMLTIIISTYAVFGVVERTRYRVTGVNKLAASRNCTSVRRQAKLLPQRVKPWPLVGWQAKLPQPVKPCPLVGQHLWYLGCIWHNYKGLFRVRFASTSLASSCHPCVPVCCSPARSRVPCRTRSSSP